MSLNKDLTIIFVSYFSKKLIEKPLNTISKEIKVLIIENSLDLSAKNELESKYSNVKVIFPKENLGNGGGINEGLKLVDTKYAFYLDIDTLLKKDTLEQLYLHANKIENFSALRANKISVSSQFIFLKIRNHAKLFFCNDKNIDNTYYITQQAQI